MHFASEQPNDAPPPQPFISIGKLSIDSSTNEPMKIDIAGALSAIKIHVPLVQLVKIPHVKDGIAKVLGFQEKKQNDAQGVLAVEESEDAPIILSNMLPAENNNPKNKPFFISLSVGNLLLHNCMFDSGASTNVMPLAVMKRLGLKISRPYKNICAMDS